MDGDPAEARLLEAPVSAMVARLQALLGLFPEQPILEQLLAICRRLLALPLHSPLGRLLTGVELLHRKGLEWEVPPTHTHTGHGPRVARPPARTSVRAPMEGVRAACTRTPPERSEQQVLAAPNSPAHVRGRGSAPAGESIILRAGRMGRMGHRAGWAGRKSRVDGQVG